jgi:parallel beta-helix repeat protein
MNRIRLTFRLLVVCTLLIAGTSLAHAQLSRTWVSGVGDDINPCNRTAPCKTFSSAMSKTFIDGEINVLDPGGLGTVSINKSLTIDGGGTYASILAGGGAPSAIGIDLTDLSGNDPLRIVRLRNLSLSGNGPSGTQGTRSALRAIFSSSSNPAPVRVVLEHVVIDGFYAEGILYAANGGHVTVSNSTIRNNTTAGIKATNTFGTNILYLTITNSHLDHNGQEGLRAETYVRATMTGSSASENGLNGVATVSTSGASEINLDGNTIANNGQFGVVSAESLGTIRLTGNEITNNVTNGISITSGSVCTNSKNHITNPTQAPNCTFNDQ